ncbi:MAG: 23S rRNA (pseudouridine(1915)-N(3))-methyltransferase RlmH, partial [Simkania sp.]|nr:23S rRNA (pseudouridine(1915)-N(3))-methyltransferase RlmH [Simkania sp.]
MFKLTLLTTGKTKEPWLQGAVEEYTKRLKSAIELTWRLAKDDKQLEEWTLLEPHFLGLDPNGKLLHSKEWSSFLFDIWERQGCRLTMVIGGACGLTEPMKKKATALI